MNSDEYFNIGARNFSVSTEGIVSGIRRFANENLQINLAISLNAADNRTRSSLMPVNRKFPLDELFEAVDYYISKTNRKVLFEYILLSGVNDSFKDRQNLAGLLQDRLHFLNLIPYNPTEKFAGPPESKLQNFKRQLEKCGLKVGIRRSFGREIKGACGQLARDLSEFSV